MRKNIYKILTLGAAWGIFEATAGYLLHTFGFKIGWMIWFPVAYFFIHKAYRCTDSFPSVMFTAIIASSLKLINLLFPGRVNIVINPAVSILLETLAVMLIYKYVIRGQTDKIHPLTILLTGFIWRTLYICYILCMPQSYLDLAPFITMNSFLEYMFLNNVVNTIFISAGFIMAKVFKKQFDMISERLKTAVNRNAVIKPTFAIVSMVLAVITQVITR